MKINEILDESSSLKEAPLLARKVHKSRWLASCIQDVKFENIDENSLNSIINDLMRSKDGGNISFWNINEESDFLDISIGMASTGSSIPKSPFTFIYVDEENIEKTGIQINKKPATDNPYEKIRNLHVDLYIENDNQKNRLVQIMHTSILERSYKDIRRSDIVNGLIQVFKDGYLDEEKMNEDLVQKIKNKL